MKKFYMAPVMSAFQTLGAPNFDLIGVSGVDTSGGGVDHYAPWGSNW